MNKQNTELDSIVREYSNVYYEAITTMCRILLPKTHEERNGFMHFILGHSKEDFLNVVYSRLAQYKSKNNEKAN